MFLASFLAKAEMDMCPTGQNVTLGFVEHW
jgi:hypothetical protein